MIPRQRAALRAVILSISSAAAACAALGVPSPASLAAQTAGQTAGETLTLTVPGTDVSYALAWVPGGRFTLGSPDDEPGRDADEGPRRRVTVDGFWMGVTEVTFDLYALFRDETRDTPVGADGEPFPVEMITRPSPPYEDPTHGMSAPGRPMTGMTRPAAMHFARWLSEKTGRLFRLPTEAEWEYACRAGHQDAYTFGDDPADLEAHAWYEANAGGTLHEVGAKEANAFGLHDLHGNAAEWTMDRYDRNFYADLPGDGSAVNPRTEASTRGLGVVRGGSFQDGAEELRCAARYPETTRWKRRDPQMPKSRWWNTDAPHVGFRLVSPPETYTLDQIRAYWDAILGPRN